MVVICIDHHQEAHVIASARTARHGGQVCMLFCRSGVLPGRGLIRVVISVGMYDALLCHTLAACRAVMQLLVICCCTNRKSASRVRHGGRGGLLLPSGGSVINATLATATVLPAQ